MDHCVDLGLVIDLTNTTRYYDPKVGGGAIFIAPVTSGKADCRFCSFSHLGYSAFGIWFTMSLVLINSLTYPKLETFIKFLPEDVLAQHRCH